MTTSTQGLAFEQAAADYAANRPSYPPALIDAVEDLAGRPVAGARVADVGAGTGLGTALLHARGAHVVAVEPGPMMAAQLRRTLPGVSLVRGDGNRLPLASASVDLVTYAQAWHWTDPARSVPEARRVLRPGGALALWWNDQDSTDGWAAAQLARVRRFLGAEDDANQGPPDLMVRFRRLPPGLDFGRRQVAWTRRVTVGTHLANLASYSDFLVRDADTVAAFLAAERDHLSALFPGGTLEEKYVVSLAVARP
ncbi:methyltransferase domain-containing protein [Streptomyces sp. SID8379]|uniref:class I SAM-dependent methyltransferase n=1 Tax=unclassified Streptomyces TaxID=2593676 RepID=UPI00036915C5|nr:MULTISPECIES: class I SAM-dependent methyltransferase [unclassified Streptomyces]MYW68506.1 methyltransferase domain-containing protein [Streptomyces sp. SID8379]